MLSTLSCLLIALAGEPTDSNPRVSPEAVDYGATAQNDLPYQGIWPTPKMIDGLLARWTDETAEEYGLNSDQRVRLENQLAKRWPPFLRQHRRVLQPLLNEFLEVRIAPTPPDAQSVSAWAQRAVPVFQLFQEQFIETQREMADLFTPPQQASLARNSLKTTAGLQLFQAKLEAWQRGHFAEHEWWDPPKSVLRRRAEKTSSRVASAAPSTARQRIDEELFRWDRFVDQFARTYELNTSQRETAYSILRECKQRALAHRDRYRARMERLEKTINTDHNITDEGRPEIIAMYGPIDRIFTELETRLKPIPTAVQSINAKPTDSNPWVSGTAVGPAFQPVKRQAGKPVPHRPSHSDVQQP
ncbi:MAG: hypothetical protein V3W34_04255 [Phycisphaerae bacterium]